ncbi:MAG TPA: DPP IV N-terminal domain-containing protein [Terriglobales bacterium]|nr:DPP IV N-terminal domain-containing protein [Terriglobales bacterium]
MKRPFAVGIALFLALSSCVLAQSAQETKKPLTIEAIVAPGGLTGRGPESLKWSPDGTKLSWVQRDDSGEHGELWYIDPATGEKKVLVSEAKLATLAPDVTKIKNEIQKEKITRYGVAAYHWAPDSKHLLFDSLGQLWLFSLDSGTAVQFASSGEDPKFSPNGKMLAYLRSHNLYVHATDSSDERQLTKDKDENILNGEVDWVYEEELDVRSNYFWSPDSSQIVFLQMNETRVPTYPITDYSPVTATVQQQKYPKPGDPNPVVRLGVINSKGGNVKWIKLTDNDDTYIPRFGWVRDGILWAELLNRAQDTIDLYFIDAKSGHSRKVLTDSSKDAWVDVNNDFYVLKSGDRFLWSSWRDGHTHIYLYSFDKQNPVGADAKQERQLEQGDYEVTEVDAVDEDSGRVFFSANKDDPRQTQIFSVKLDGSGLEQISKGPGTHASDSGLFSNDGKHFAESYSATLVAPKRQVCASSGSPCYPIWQSRDVAQYDWLAPKDLELKAADGSTTLYAHLVLPQQSSSAKVPLIVFIYGGPAGQTVLNQWGSGVTDPFNQIMAENGYAIFSVDNRGTPRRGKQFMSAIRHQFGAVELKDQLAALDQVFAQYPQLDKSRVCIWGWSNGGSMTLYSLLHSRAYRCGVAGAPVTDWRLYDSTYTERYMGLPKENPQPYDSSLPSGASNLNDSLLLIHGTSDDNVHVQNSIQMIDALINARKQFRLMFYPGKVHGVTGDARIHLNHMMQDFLEQNLK